MKNTTTVDDVGSSRNAHAPLVDISRVSKSFGSNEVLKDVSLQVEKGQVVCIIGPSGSGKSTLLNCVNHLEPIDSGSIKTAGQYIGYRREKDGLHKLSEYAAAKQRRAVGMVFQQFNLFPHMTVRENVTFSQTHVLKRSRTEATTTADDLLARVGLGGEGRCLSVVAVRGPTAESGDRPSIGAGSTSHAL